MSYELDAKHLTLVIPNLSINPGGRNYYYWHFQEKKVSIREVKQLFKGTQLRRMSNARLLDSQGHELNRLCCDFCIMFLHNVFH